MEHLGNKVTFAADEVETYGVGLDGALTVTLKQDARTDTAYNPEDQDMPKINANGIPSYEGHEGTVQSASGLLYDVDPSAGEPVGGYATGPVNATNPHAGATDARDEDDERKQELRGREVGLVTPLEDDDKQAEDRTLGDEGDKQDEDRSADGTDTRRESAEDEAQGTAPKKATGRTTFKK